MISKSYPLPKSLLGAVHYHQPAGSDPGEFRIRVGVERVELVTGGRGWVLMDGTWVEVTAGALLWQIAGDETIGRSDWDDPYRCLAVNFGVGRKAIRRVARLTRWPDIDEVRRFTQRVVETYVDESFSRDALLAYAYGQLIFQAERWLVGRDAGFGKAGVGDAVLGAVLERIETGFSERLTLASLAGSVGWSAPHLHRVFKEATGTSPHQFLLNRRIQAARYLLISTDFAVKRIAFECGFVNASAFCHAFKARVGLQPLEYRRLESARDFRC